MLFFCHLRLRVESAPRDILTPELVALEIQRIHELLAEGTIRGAWKTNESVAIIALFNASNEQECRGIISTLPFSQAGIVAIELFLPVEPYTVVYPAPTEG